MRSLTTHQLRIMLIRMKLTWERAAVEEALQIRVGSQDLIWRMAAREGVQQEAELSM